MFLTTNKELLEKHLDDMWTCARCSLCKFPPLAQIKSQRFSGVCCSMDYGYFHAWSGSGKIIMGLSLLENRVEGISDRMRDAILQCSLCGACDVSCKYSTNMEVLETIFDLRQYLVETDGAHPVHQMYLQKAIEFHNPYGEPHNLRQNWIASTNAIQNPASSTLFFTGCTAAYRQQEIVKASAEILTAGSVDFRLSTEEQCCGSPIYRSGQVKDTKQFFKHTLEFFEKENVRKVITACPGCYSMFVAEYPKYLDSDLFEIWESIEFNHMVQVIEDLIAKKKIEFIEPEEIPSTKRKIVTYHDPCHLGRGAEPWVPPWNGTIKKIYNQIKIYDPPKTVRRGTKGVYKAARTILKKLEKHLDFIEMQRINEYSYCCGSGGGVKAAYPEMALEASSERLEEAEFVLDTYCQKIPDSHKIDFTKILVSACPFCKTNFEDGIKQTGKSLHYLDINQLVRELMKKEGD